MGALLGNDKNVDEMYSIFIAYLKDNINNIMPKILMKISPNRIEQEPWIPCGILKSSQRLKKNSIKTLQVTCTDGIMTNDTYY